MIRLHCTSEMGRTWLDFSFFLVILSRKKSWISIFSCCKSFCENLWHTMTPSKYLTSQWNIHGSYSIEENVIFFHKKDNPFRICVLNRTPLDMRIMVFQIIQCLMKGFLLFTVWTTVVLSCGLRFCSKLLHCVTTVYM